MSRQTAFGNWLRHARARQGALQDELAAQLGCSGALLRKLEAGERRPSEQIAAPPPTRAASPLRSTTWA